MATYLGLIVADDRTKASKLLCGGEDDVATARLRDTALTDWTGQRITSYVILGSRQWSSIDGHGTVYGVRLTLSKEATATTDVVVEVIGDEPCVGTDIPL